MKKTELVAAILNDMYLRKSIYTTKEQIDKAQRAWLSRQNKATLVEIYNNRMESARQLALIQK